MFCSNSCFVMTLSFRSLTLKSSEALKACAEGFYRKCRSFAFASNPKIPQTKLLRFWPRHLKCSLRFGLESNLICRTKVKRRRARWKLNTEAVCELGWAVILAFTSRAKFSWIWVLFTFILAPENYFKPLIDLLGGRRGLHSTWLSVLISFSLQAFYRIIPLPYKLPVNLNIKWTRQNVTVAPPRHPTARNFPLCLEI